MAGSVGLLPGVGIGPVFAQALPGPMSALMAQTAVVILSFMILVGRGIRPAALLLSIALFWSSYLQMQSLGVAHELAHYWRDLGLIGALLLTYTAQAEPGRMPQLFRRRARARKPGEKVTPRRIARDATIQSLIRFPQRPQKPLAIPVPGPEPVFSSARQGASDVVPLLASEAEAPYRGAEPSFEAEQDGPGPSDNIFAEPEEREAG